jgi:hypothetical protein
MIEEIPDNFLDLSPKMRNAMGLISALCDERITAEQFAELDSLVCNDPEVGRFYASIMHLNVSLHHFAFRLAQPMSEPADSDILGEDGTGEGTQAIGMNESMELPALNEPISLEDSDELFAPPPSADFKTRPGANGRKALIKGGIAAIITIGLGFLAYYLPSVGNPRSDQFNSPITKPPWYVASVDLNVNSVWEASARPDNYGNVIGGESVILKSGAVQLRLGKRGRLILEGPAEVRFISDIELRVNYGKIVATFPGGGLIVRTPTGTITDLGTEFGVSVSQEGSADVEVFEGRVAASLTSAAATQPTKDLLLVAGQAAIISDKEVAKSPEGAVPQRFICSLQNEQVDSLDVTDLVCGGNGTTHRRGIAIDSVMGSIGNFTPVSKRAGDRKYHAVKGFPVVDGAFIPDGSRGAMQIDSGGHQFKFAPTTGLTMNMIWTGGHIPWPDKPGISTIVSGVDYAASDHSIISTHSNNGLTLDLGAVRRIYCDRMITGFHCRCGNSYSPDSGWHRIPKTPPVAGVCVIVDGLARYEHPHFSNQDGLFSIDISLHATDRFVTLAATDDGKDISEDWILWLDPKFDLSRPR